MPIWPRKIPAWFWAWSKWVDNDRQGPRPKEAPRLIPPWAWARYLVHRGHKPPAPQTPPSLFDHLGGFVSQAGSFPPDTESAKAFVKAGGRWLAVQFGDPATDQGNRRRFEEGWALRWRQEGVRVGAWWRVEQVGIPVPVIPPVDFLIPNPEQAHELERLPGILTACRELLPKSAALAVITLGKVPGFPTGLLETHDAHLVPECFLETATSDTSVTNSARYWLASTVARERIHPCLLHKPGYVTNAWAAAREAAALNVHGLSSFTAENTPATEWKAMT